MKQEVPKPVIIIAVIAALALAIFLGKSVVSGSPRPSKEEMAKFTPSWIDPVTNKARANTVPQTGGPGSPPAGMNGGAPSGTPGSPPMGSSGSH